jgi:predicted molibdopterin-dependent oxidoreductase YjgC
MYLMLGCNLERCHGVVGSYVRRGVLHRKAKLVKVNPRHTWLTGWTDLNLPIERGKDVAFLSVMLKYLWEMGKAKLTLDPEMEKKLRALDDADVTNMVGVPAAEIRRAAEMYAGASKPMILCGRGLTRRGPAGITAAMNIVKSCRQKTPQGRWRLVELSMGANSAGARLLGPTGVDIRMLEPQSADVAFVVLGDEDPTWERDWMERLRTVSFVVAMIAREHDVMDIAHVVIPTAAWAERSGTYVNFEGRVQKGVRLMDPPSHVVDEVAFFENLAKTWRGPYCGWAPPEIPEMVRHLADGHMVPCHPKERPVDVAGLEALVAE